MERVKIEQSKREVVVNIKDYLKLKKMRAKKDGGKGKVKDWNSGNREKGRIEKDEIDRKEGLKLKRFIAGEWIKNEWIDVWEKDWKDWQWHASNCSNVSQILLFRNAFYSTSNCISLDF
jgi:hypothetical protein